MLGKNARKISLVLIITIMVTIMPWQSANAAEKVPNVNAHAYVVMDANTGEVLFSMHDKKRIYPASTAKLMTAIVAVENAPLSKKIKTKQSVLREIPSDASKIGLKANYIYTLDNLLQMTLIVSAADATNTLAAGISGTTKKFVTKMNQKASELKLTNTSFDNAIGLDIGNGYNKTYTTARDYSVLARYAMSKAAIRRIVAMKTYQVPNTIKKSSVKLKNTNLFYSTEDYSKNRYTIIGSKTGTTRAAGSVLIATAKDNDNHEIICAFFGNVNRSSTYKDVRKLLDYTFNEFDNGNIILSKGFYDIRFRDSEALILDYCNKGLLEGTKDGAFQPESNVKEIDFVNTVNKIANSNFVSITNNKNITVLAFANILMNAYPVSVTEDSINELKDKFVYSKKLSKVNLQNLTALYKADILPKDYDYEVESYINREDMVFIGDRLIQYLNNYENLTEW